MIKEKIQSLVESVKIKEGENNKRKIENLVVFLIILVITVIMINTIWNNNETKKEEEDIDTGKVLAKIDNMANSENLENKNESLNLEEKLKNILSKIEGVGNVEILITYSESSKVTSMYNEDSTKSDTEEKDTSRRK